MGFQIENISKTNTESKKSNFDVDSLLKKEITLFGSSFSNKIKEDFYTELSVLLKAGVPLKDALELIVKSQKKTQNKETLQTILDAIISGQSLSEAIAKHKVFTTYEFYSLKIGEETGTLDKVSQQLGNFYARKNEQRRELIGALTYPAIILLTAVLVLLFMLRYVVPMFKDIFEQQKVKLPAITEFIISISDFFKDYGLLLLGGLALLIILFSIFKKNSWYKRNRDNLILRLPFVGNFVKTVYLSQFTQAVSLLTASRVPVINSIQMVKQMIDFQPLQTALSQVEQNILQGKSLSQSLSDHKFFDEKMIALIKVAEETNQNEFIFERLNTQYNTQVKQRSKMLSTVMEPFIILIIGVIVGIILRLS